MKSYEQRGSSKQCHNVSFPPPLRARSGSSRDSSHAAHRQPPAFATPLNLFPERVGAVHPSDVPCPRVVAKQNAPAQRLHAVALQGSCHQGVAATHPIKIALSGNAPLAEDAPQAVVAKASRFQPPAPRKVVAPTVAMKRAILLRKLMPRQVNCWRQLNQCWSPREIA